MDTIWASIKVDWHAQALCSGADDYLFFPKDETAPRLERVRKLFCDHCPVRAKCLNSALINSDSGFWGGTSTDMRAAMKRTRHRAKCPVCFSDSLINVEGDDEQSSYQVCLACAVSWRSDSRLYLVITEVPAEAATS
jgi:hypothetical protein